MSTTTMNDEGLAAMPDNPLILREKRSTAGGSTFSVDAWFLSLFRHISECCGSKMGAETLALPGHRHARGSGHECLATDDVTRTLEAIGASGPGCGCQQGAWVSTDATERFLFARERASQFHSSQRPTNAVPTNAATR